LAAAAAASSSWLLFELGTSKELLMMTWLKVQKIDHDDVHSAATTDYLENKTENPYPRAL
jgi:hypothetical protein